MRSHYIILGLIISISMGCLKESGQTSEKPEELTERTVDNSQDEGNPSNVGEDVVESNSTQESLNQPLSAHGGFNPTGQYMGKYWITTGDGLRMRDNPTLDGALIEELPLGTKLLHLDSSSQMEAIGSYNDYWYNIETLQGKRGWVYGAFIQEILAADLISEERRSRFVGMGLLDLRNIPSLRMPITGYEGGPDVMNQGETIQYDSMYKWLMFSPPIPASHQLTLKLTAPSGLEFSRNYSNGDGAVRLVDWDDFAGGPLDNPYTTINLKNLAAFGSGTWEYQLLSVGGLIRKGSVDIESSNITVTPEPEPNPFDTNTKPIIQRGDALHIFGSVPWKNRAGYLVVYHIGYPTGEDNLLPMLAIEVESDEMGMFSVELLIGDDLPPGEYKLAQGTSVDNLSVELFDAWFQIVDP